MSSRNTSDFVVVCGGGGFIGGHLVADLRRQGYRRIRAVDCKPQSEWYQRFPDVENVVLDLEGKAACYTALQGADVVYNLAADMGGMGFIELNKGLCMLSVLINTHLLDGGPGYRGEAVLLCVKRLRLQRGQTARPECHGAQGSRCLSGAAGGRVRLGEAVLASACAGISGRTSASRRAWRGTTTSTVPLAPSKAAARRPQPRSAAR
jgi:hypothetical protein